MASAKSPPSLLARHFWRCRRPSGTGGKPAKFWKTTWSHRHSVLVTTRFGLQVLFLHSGHDMLVTIFVIEISCSARSPETVWCAAGKKYQYHIATGCNMSFETLLPVKPDTFHVGALPCGKLLIWWWICRVESSWACTPKQWRAQVGTGVKKRWIIICTRNFRSTPAEVDEVVQMRFPQLLVFSSVHSISKIFVSTIWSQFMIPTVWRTSGIAQEETKLIHV